MRILIDIGHPAHVHYYKHLARELEKRGNEVFWTVKDIAIAKRLLSHYGFKYFTLPKKSDKLLGKIFKQFWYDILILWFCLQKRIDVAIGTSVSIAHVSRISRITSLVFDDDDDDAQPLVTRFSNPLADMLISPDALRNGRKRKDTIFYPGYHELAYLHPNRFIPDHSILTELGIDRDQPYFVMRFNAFKAHHDKGAKGFSLNQKMMMIDILKDHGKVFITAERNIESVLRQYQLKISPEKIHSLIYYSSMFIGDSQTMTSEASVLGVPSLRCNSFVGKLSYLEEEEHTYNLTYGFKPENFENLLQKLKELLSISDLKAEWRIRRGKMLADKIDVTAFWVWLVENYKRKGTLIIDFPGFWEQFK